MKKLILILCIAAAMALCACEAGFIDGTPAPSANATTPGYTNNAMPSTMPSAVNTLPDVTYMPDAEPSTEPDVTQTAMQ